MSVVVDASLIVALVVADERQAAVQAHLARWVESGQVLHAPGVLAYEVANVLARLTFDGKLPADDIAEIWSDLAELDLVLHQFDLTQDGPAVAAITAQLRRRHATDSTYIRLAMQLGTVVWTLTAHSPATRPTSDCPSDSSPDGTDARAAFRELLGRMTPSPSRGQRAGDLDAIGRVGCQSVRRPDITVEVRMVSGTAGEGTAEMDVGRVPEHPRCLDRWP